MARKRVPTHQEIIIVGCLSIAPNKEMYGQELTRLVGLDTGTVYPLLHRLTQSNMIEKRQEEGDKKKLGRPLRMYYRLTEKGVAYVAAYKVIMLAASHYNTQISKADPQLVPFELFNTQKPLTN